jgi:hypothetical protein
MALSTIIVLLCTAIGALISPRIVPNMRLAYVALYIVLGVMISAAAHYQLGLMATVFGIGALIVGLLISSIHFRSTRSS